MSLLSKIPTNKGLERTHMQGRIVSMVIANKHSRAFLGMALLLLFALLISCEGMRFAEGYVYDANTGNPIDSVYCEVLSGADWTYTDSLGYYYVENDFGGCVFGCADIEIEYSKPGYKSIFKINPKGDIELLLTEE